MAAIDRIYVNGYDEYLQIRDFFLTHDFITPMGNKVRLKHYLYHDTTNMSAEEIEKTKEWYNSGIRPATNTPTYVDRYLYDNCDIDIVREYLESAYWAEGDELRKKLAPVYPDRPIATKLKLVHKGTNAANTAIPFYNHYTNRKMRRFSVDVFYEGESWLYNVKADKMYEMRMREPYHSSSADFYNTSIKAIKRRILTKWKLPVGCTVRISGRFVGEDYIFRTA